MVMKDCAERGEDVRRMRVICDYAAEAGRCGHVQVSQATQEGLAIVRQCGAV
jgi:hypothetical protein